MSEFPLKGLAKQIFLIDEIDEVLGEARQALVTYAQQGGGKIGEEFVPAIKRLHLAMPTAYREPYRVVREFRVVMDNRGCARFRTEFTDGTAKTWDYAVAAARMYDKMHWGMAEKAA